MATANDKHSLGGRPGPKLLEPTITHILLSFSNVNRSFLRRFSRVDFNYCTVIFDSLNILESVQHETCTCIIYSTYLISHVQASCSTDSIRLLISALEVIEHVTRTRETERVSTEYARASLARNRNGTDPLFP